jgi:hydrogenase nickel incorporation protein HypA/HybF
MHELSIALSLIETACEEMSRLGATRVNAVHMRLGPLSGVVKDALVFSFDAAAAGTPIEGARLEIEDVPVTVWCAVCDAKRELASLARRRCPACDAPTPDILTGEELELTAMEVVDA